MKTIKLKHLTQDNLNANQGTARGAGMIERSLSKHGAGRSILVDKQGRIIAGNKTHQAAAEIGLSEDAVLVETDGTQLVVVKRTDIDLDSPEGRALAIADNRAAQVGLDWNIDALAEIAQDVDLSEYWFEGEIEIPDIELAPSPDSFEGLAEDDETPEVSEDVVSKRGDLWLLGDHRVLCGDSTSAEDVARLMGGELADSLITDPPYGVSYAEKNEALNRLDGGDRKTTLIENDSMTIGETGEFWQGVFSLAFEYTKKGGTYYIAYAFKDDSALEMLMAIKKSGWLLKHEIIWAKNNHVLGRCDYNYKHEPILYGWKPGAGHYFGGTGSDTSVWCFDKPQSSKLHPTMKPVELIAHAAERGLKPGEVMFDPFLGSGTAVIAAEKTGRRCYGLELSPAYVDVIVRRWQSYTGNTATLESGETFEQVETTRAAAS